MTSNIPPAHAGSASSQSLMPSRQPTSNRTTGSPSPEEIARRAYQIYLDRGSPQGCDIQHWLEAEAQVMKARKAGAGSVLM